MADDKKHIEEAYARGQRDVARARDQGLGYSETYEPPRKSSFAESIWNRSSTDQREIEEEKAYKDGWNNAYKQPWKRR